jgi:hypothetical protein
VKKVFFCAVFVKSAQFFAKTREFCGEMRAFWSKIAQFFGKTRAFSAKSAQFCSKLAQKRG